MNIAIRAVLAGVAMCALAAPAHAYTINGTIPAVSYVEVELRQPIGSGILQLTLSSPPVNAGVPYVIDFCVGPAPNPCSNPSHVGLAMSVVPGHSAVVPLEASYFTSSHYIITVGQGTHVAVPYSLEVDVLP